MKPSVYLETTIISYLTARPVKNLVLAAKMEVTRDWWESHAHKFDLFVSDVVRMEASAGDPDAARKRLEVIDSISRLSNSAEADELATVLFHQLQLPPEAEDDALHMAVAAVNGLDFLLTWNCRHIANASLRNRIETVCHQAGYQPPMICTPLELFEA